ncbi:MAG: BrnA antitoxin family protein [Propionibacteriaceae bacterium]|jgi:hypothetical protein|nr:BrnA antitoxin family protein [Propionibacteriaceae bacterium]
MSKQADTISAEQFDQMFDDGADVTPYLDLRSTRRPNREPKRINIDLSAGMIQDLDAEARRIGVTRQSLIKVWLDERIQQQKAAA